MIQERLELLSVLAYYIGKDFEMPVLPNQPGQGWYWNFQRNEVRADPKDILEKPLDYSRFVISHEGSHVRITRISDAARKLWTEDGFAFLTNCIEDPRVNNFVVHAYPFLKEKMALTYSSAIQLEQDGLLKRLAARLGFEPLSAQAGLEYVRAWLREKRDGKTSLSKALHPKVRKVLEATINAAAQAWRRYLSSCSSVTI